MNPAPPVTRTRTPRVSHGQSRTVEASTVVDDGRCADDGATGDPRSGADDRVGTDDGLLDEMLDKERPAAKKGRPSPNKRSDTNR